MVRLAGFEPAARGAGEGEKGGFSGKFAVSFRRLSRAFAGLRGANQLQIRYTPPRGRYGVCEAVEPPFDLGMIKAGVHVDDERACPLQAP